MKRMFIKQIWRIIYKHIVTIIYGLILIWTLTEFDDWYQRSGPSWANSSISNLSVVRKSSRMMSEWNLSSGQVCPARGHLQLPTEIVKTYSYKDHQIYNYKDCQCACLLHKQDGTGWQMSSKIFSVCNEWGMLRSVYIAYIYSNEWSLQGLLTTALECASPARVLWISIENFLENSGLGCLFMMKSQSPTIPDQPCP